MSKGSRESRGVWCGSGGAVVHEQETDREVEGGGGVRCRWNREKERKNKREVERVVAYLRCWASCAAVVLRCCSRVAKNRSWSAQCDPMNSEGFLFTKITGKKMDNEDAKFFLK